MHSLAEVEALKTFSACFIYARAAESAREKRHDWPAEFCPGT